MSYEDLDAVLEQCEDAHDPLLIRFARAFAGLGHKRLIPDIEYFNAWAKSSHPTFATLIDEIHATKHAEALAAREARLAHAAAKAAEAQKAAAHTYTGGTSSAKPKRNRKTVKKTASAPNLFHTGVKTITAEQAQKLRKRGFAA